MNILPFIFSILLVLSCVTYAFLREAKSFSLMELTFTGFHKTERTLSNTLVKKAYYAIDRKKKDPSKPKTPSSSSSKIKTYTSRRLSFPPLDCCKLNMMPLIEHPGELHLHPLYEPLAALLRIMYEGHLFPAQSKTEYHLIEAVIDKYKAQKHTPISDLVELSPYDPVLAKIFYKMLKGTNQYNRTEGIPPLGDVIKLSADKKAISACYASPYILEAVFGPEITTKIMNEEQKKWEETQKYYAFSKSDFEDLLAKYPQKNSKFQALEELFNFSKSLSPRTVIGEQDSRTGIRVKRECINKQAINNGEAKEGGW